MTMIPSLRSSFPIDLLILILSLLPLLAITRLRCVCNEWKKNVTCVYLVFNRACDKANSNMLAFLSHTQYSNEFWVKILNSSKNKWYAYRFCLEDCKNMWTKINEAK